MTTYKLATFLFLGFCLLCSACGDSGSTGQNSNTETSSTTGRNSNTGSSAGNISSNSSVIASTANPGNSKPAGPDPGKVPTGELGQVDNNPMVKRAPDGSVVTTALGENLVQTRVFNNHPQIVKVESETAFEAGKQKVTVKVYLRNGQVRELPENAVANPMTDPAQNILKAIK